MFTNGLIALSAILHLSVHERKHYSMPSSREPWSRTRATSSRASCFSAVVALVTSSGGMVVLETFHFYRLYSTKHVSFSFNTVAHVNRRYVKQLSYCIRNGIVSKHQFLLDCLVTNGGMVINRVLEKAKLSKKLK